MRLGINMVLCCFLLCFFTGCIPEGSLKTIVKGKITHYRTKEAMRNHQFKVRYNNTNYEMTSDSEGDYQFLFDWKPEIRQFYLEFESSPSNYSAFEKSSTMGFYFSWGNDKVIPERVNEMDVSYLPRVAFVPTFEQNPMYEVDSIYLSLYVNSSTFTRGGIGFSRSWGETSPPWTPHRYALAETDRVDVTQKLRLKGQATMQQKTFTYSLRDSVTIHKIKYEP